MNDKLKNKQKLQMEDIYSWLKWNDKLGRFPFSTQGGQVAEMTNKKTYSIV